MLGFQGLTLFKVFLGVIKALNTVTVISIKFLLVISCNVYSTLDVIRINYDTNKVNFLDILMTSPQYFYKESMGTR